MTTSSLPVVGDRDSRLKLTVENRTRNIFVTQLDEKRQTKEENVNYLPVVTETSSKILEAGVHTLQRTLILKKQAELDEVDKQLTLKRLEFKHSIEALAKRRSELEMKQQETKERVMKFEKFVVENEEKRLGAMKKYEAARKQSILKQKEIDDLTEQLKELKSRHHVLKEKIAKYKIYEDYLVKTLDFFPKTYHDNESDSSVMAIIQRHETLSITNQRLLQRWELLEEEVDQRQQQLHTMKMEHSIRKLRAIKELSELQSELETLKEKNKQAEAHLLMEQGLSREKVEEMGSVLMAINNLAEQCYLPTYGPLENMNLLAKMDMVKEFILDLADTEKRARRLMESGSAVTSRTALTDKRGRGSMKSISSKTQIKSSSKVSRKSEATS
ncbi:coiled-coil domain-containing protein 42 homolog [Cheilinus undulatus]|uniref:coiled-coil domain-containing protein 42 homolog n=1 Tax=Cheilinus undulatus TaxID=241271 RepID=UPI001BD3543F|nr:coiled-coil domain-containing protein 42 homolog [Cheilinus undulatus]